jgi:hypothetical protein
MLERFLSSPLDLADGLQVTVEYGAVVVSELPLKVLRSVSDEIEDAVGLIPDERAFFRVVAFTEQLQENLSWIVFHRQRRLCIAEGQRCIGTAAARSALNDGLGSEFQRRQRCLLADHLRDHLIESRSHMRSRTAASIGPRGAEPRRRVVGVNRAGAGRILQIAERSHVLLVGLQRGEDRAEFEIGARTARRPFIHGRSVRGVVHDRAVRNIEKAGAHLRRCGGLTKRRCRGQHRIQKRQSQTHSGALQNRPS